MRKCVRKRCYTSWNSWFPHYGAREVEIHLSAVIVQTVEKSAFSKWFGEHSCFQQYLHDFWRLWKIKFLDFKKAHYYEGIRAENTSPWCEDGTGRWEALCISLGRTTDCAGGRTQLPHLQPHLALIKPFLTGNCLNVEDDNNRSCSQNGWGWKRPWKITWSNLLKQDHLEVPQTMTRRVFLEPQTILGIGRDLKDHIFPTSLAWAGTFRGIYMHLWQHCREEKEGVLWYNLYTHSTWCAMIRTLNLIQKNPYQNQSLFSLAVSCIDSVTQGSLQKLNLRLQKLD